MIRSTRSTYPIYAGDYIGGGAFARPRRHAGGMGSFATKWQEEWTPFKLTPPDQPRYLAQEVYKGLLITTWASGSRKAGDVRVEVGEIGKGSGMGTFASVSEAKRAIDNGYVGGGVSATVGTPTIKLSPPDQPIPTAETTLPVNGGAGPEPLSTPQPGELGPQVTTQAMKAPQDQPVPTTNPNEVEPLRIAIAAQEAVAEEQDHTANLIKLGLLGIGGAMAIYGLGRVLEKHRARRRR